MEKRKVNQIEKLDENGDLEYTIIPNYKVHDNFLTKNELTLYKALISTIIKLRDENDLNLKIFAQVALNRIIDVNNERKKGQLFKKICSKSIDFVLYNEKTNEIHCCIELDDESHLKEERLQRDILLDKVFKDNIKLIHIKRQNYYEVDTLIELIIKQ